MEKYARGVGRYTVHDGSSQAWGFMRGLHFLLQKLLCLAEVRNNRNRNEISQSEISRLRVQLSWPGAHCEAVEDV